MASEDPFTYVLVELKGNYLTTIGRGMQAEVLEDMMASEDPSRPATTVARLISDHRSLSKLIDGFIDVSCLIPWNLNP